MHISSKMAALGHRQQHCVSTSFTTVILNVPVV